MIPVTNGSIGGVAIVAIMNAVHIAAGHIGSVHPAIMAISVTGACSVRRRLSIIFQRPSDGIDDRPSRGGEVAASALEPCARPNIHGSSCQSPRAHRCCLAAATSYREGNSSTSSTSDANPARAKVPSKRSWLKSVLSGTRSASAASNTSTS